MEQRRHRASIWVLFGILAVLGVCTADPATGDEKNSDAKKLLGKWQAISGEYNGKPLTDKESAHFGLSIDANYFTFLSGGKPHHRHTYSLHTMDNPRGISLHTVDTRALFDRSAIYVLEGDTLKICIQHGKTRPTGFMTKSDGKATVYVLKKQ